MSTYAPDANPNIKAPPRIPGFVKQATEIAQRVFTYVKSNVHERVWNLWDLCAVFVACAARCFPGPGFTSGLEMCPRPEETLICYMFEGCPSCMRTREALNVLNLSYRVYPCPQESVKSVGYILNSKYRQQLLKEAGRVEFPYVYDPNTKVGVFGADDAIKYLFDKYGQHANVGLNYWFSNLHYYFRASIFLRFMARPMMDMGYLRTPATHRELEKPLNIYTHEGNPWGKLVREAVDTCEIAYIMHPTGTTAKKPSTATKTCWCCAGVLVVDPNGDGHEYTCANDFLKKLRTSWRTAPAADELFGQFGEEDGTRGQKKDQ